MPPGRRAFNKYCGIGAPVLVPYCVKKSVASGVQYTACTANYLSVTLAELLLQLCAPAEMHAEIFFHA